MKNVDRWFILIGILYATFGFSFGIWVGINQRLEQAHLHAHINLIGYASMVLFGLIYRAFPSMTESRLAAAHFILFNIGAVVFLVGIPLAQSGQTIALAAGGSLTLLTGLLVFLANYLLNGFSARARA